MSTIGHSFTSPSLGQYTSCNTVPIRWHPTPITGDFEASYPVFIQDTKGSAPMGNGDLISGALFRPLCGKALAAAD